jgi:hypothetical protein
MLVTLSKVQTNGSAEKKRSSAGIISKSCAGQVHPRGGLAKRESPACLRMIEMILQRETAPFFGAVTNCLENRRCFRGSRSGVMLGRASMFGWYVAPAMIEREQATIAYHK